MQELLLYLITILHLLFILFVVVTPLTNSTYFLFLHAIFVPFMIFHWILNDNTCALTVIEKKIREQLYGTVQSEDCFTCRLIEPVYDFKKNYSSFSTMIYIITISLWLVSVYKLYNKYKSGEISEFGDLFII